MTPLSSEVLKSLEELLAAIDAACSSPGAQPRDLRPLIDRLAAFLEAHPEVAAALVERALFLDRGGSSRSVDTILAAIGQARNVGALELALSRYEAFSTGGRTALALSAAQDRGRSTRDPSGTRSFADLFALDDIGEPAVRAALLDRARAAEQRRSAADPALGRLLTVLALSAHRDAEVDALLRRLASTKGPLQDTALSEYLQHSRTEGARAEALAVLQGLSNLPTGRLAHMVQLALGTLRRVGVSHEQVRTVVLASYGTATVEARCALLRGCTQLLGRVSDDCDRELASLIAEACRDADASIRAAALSAAADAAVRLNGWDRLGLVPLPMIRDEGFEAASRGDVASAWASLYLSRGEHAADFETLLGDARVVVSVRESAWRGLVRSDWKKNADRVRALARRFSPEEPDEDLGAYLAELAGGQGEDRPRPGRRNQ